MGSRALWVKVGAVVLAAALSIGSGIVGAQTTPPASAVTASGAAPYAVAVATAVPPAPTAPIGPAPIPTAAPTATASTQYVERVEPTRSPLSVPAVTSVSMTPVPSPVSPVVSATPVPGGDAGAAPAGPSPAVARVLEHSVRGAIIAVQGSTLLVRPVGGGRDVRVAVDTTTLITQDRQHVTVAALRLGSPVVALGAPRDDGALAARAMLVSPPARPAPGREPPRAPRGRPPR